MKLIHLEFCLPIPKATIFLNDMESCYLQKGRNLGDQKTWYTQESPNLTSNLNSPTSCVALQTK
jgi:hypothetical protein